MKIRVFAIAAASSGGPGQRLEARTTSRHRFISRSRCSAAGQVDRGVALLHNSST